MKASKSLIFSLALLILGCACVATKKTTKKSRKSDFSGQSGDPPSVSATCPENVSGEEKYCQVFTQQGGKSNRPIDILWVIDNSTSMCGNQAKLAQNFGSFINKFSDQSEDVDFKMALISAPKHSKGPVTYRSQDFGGKGFSTTPLMRMYYIQYGTTLTASDLKLGKQSFINRFQATINQIGCRGHSMYAESGLVMSLDFLEENQTWLRPNAFLIVIHVSDQYDAGRLATDSDGRTKLVYGSLSCSSTLILEKNSDCNYQVVAKYYIDTLTSHKGSKFLFKVFSVVNDPASIIRNFGHHNPPRFHEVAKLSGGKAYDIDGGSFDTILKDFGKQVAEVTSQFPLKYPVSMGTVEVFVDGIPAPQSNWRYLEDQNAIRFEDGVFKGKKGEVTIKVTYRTK